MHNCKHRAVKEEECFISVRNKLAHLYHSDAWFQFHFT